jgi:hypothetical protein
MPWTWHPEPFFDGLLVSWVRSSCTLSTPLGTHGCVAAPPSIHECASSPRLAANTGDLGIVPRLAASHHWTGGVDGPGRPPTGFTRSPPTTRRPPRRHRRRRASARSAGSPRQPRRGRGWGVWGLECRSVSSRSLWPEIVRRAEGERRVLPPPEDSLAERPRDGTRSDGAPGVDRLDRGHRTGARPVPSRRPNVEVAPTFRIRRLRALARALPSPPWCGPSGGRPIRGSTPSVYRRTVSLLDGGAPR